MELQVTFKQPNGEHVTVTRHLTPSYDGPADLFDVVYKVAKLSGGREVVSKKCVWRKNKRGLYS